MPGRLPIDLKTMRRLAREMRDVETTERPLVVAGARELATVLARELGKDAVPGAVREGGAIDRPAALLYLLAGEPNEDDTRELRAAGRAKVPVVCLQLGAAAVQIPQVPATDVVVVPRGQGFPLEEIGRALARRLDGDAAPLAARVPALRGAICEELIRKSSRRGGAVGVATFIRGSDLPVLFLEQTRLVLLLAIAHGRKLKPARAAELVAVLVAGLGLRKLARRSSLARALPGWLLKGSIAYAGTRAVGSGALRYFSSSVGAEGRSERPTTLSE